MIKSHEKIGSVQVGQSGSNINLRRDGVSCIVPMHKEEKKGALMNVLRQAQISQDEFLGAVK